MAKTYTPLVGKSEIPMLMLKWEIRNWLSYQNSEKGKNLFSPHFDAMGESWSLIIYPNGRNEESQGYISVGLTCHFKNNVSTDLRYLFFLTTANYQVIASFDSKKLITFNQQTNGWGPMKLASQASVREYLQATPPNDKIIILCKIVTEPYVGWRYASNPTNNVDLQSNGFESFINNKHLSDIKFIVEGKEIFAHKMILSIRSPVFAAMFQHNMRENEENIVTVEDISYEAFLYLLRFIYIDKYDSIEDSLVIHLFKASDKYQLLMLKSACEQYLSKKLSTDNVIEYLSLADMHNAIDLKRLALDYIVRHGKEMIGRPEIEALKNLNTCLLNDVFTAIFSHVK